MMTVVLDHLLDENGVEQMRLNEAIALRKLALDQITAKQADSVKLAATKKPPCKPELK
jgi:hypothetical protein